MLRLNYSKGLSSTLRHGAPLIPPLAELTPIKSRCIACNHVSKYFPDPVPQLILRSACNLIIAVCFLPRASLSHTRVRDVREIARLSSGSSHKAGFLQFQRGLGGPHLQGSHCIWVLRGERDGVSCVEKGEIATLITLFFFLSFLTC